MDNFFVNEKQAKNESEVNITLFILADYNK